MYLLKRCCGSVISFVRMYYCGRASSPLPHSRPPQASSHGQATFSSHSSTHSKVNFLYFGSSRLYRQLKTRWRSIAWKGNAKTRKETETVSIEWKENNTSHSLLTLIRATILNCLLFSFHIFASPSAEEALFSFAELTRYAHHFTVYTKILSKKDIICIYVRRSIALVVQKWKLEPHRDLFIHYFLSSRW